MASYTSASGCAMRSPLLEALALAIPLYLLLIELCAMGGK